jgi:two-component system, NtrC family, sensor kinase
MQTETSESTLSSSAEKADRAEPTPASVLIIDDEPLIQRTITRVLEGEHVFTLRSSAPDALALIRAGQRFDVIVSDIAMPVLSGVELHDALLGFAPDQAGRMIFITGGGFSQSTTDFLETVRERRLWKPFSVLALRERIRSLMEDLGPATKTEKTEGMTEGMTDGTTAAG